MLRVIKLFSVASLVCLLSACVNHLQEADTAFLKNNWDTSVSYYTKALKKAKEPAVIAHINQRLEESKVKGAKFHLKHAIDSQNTGDIENAYGHAVTAHKYYPSDESRQLVNELKVLERDRLITLGEVSLNSQLWDEAAVYLKKANKIERSAKADGLLLQAKKDKASHLMRLGRSALSLKSWDEAISLFKESNLIYRSEEAERLIVKVKEEKAIYLELKFVELYQAASSSLNARDWNSAGSNYIKAHSYGENDTSRREAEFVALMVEGEQKALLAEGNVYSAKQAESVFRKALKYRIDTKYVTARIEEVELNNYKVTIHSAIVLPVKPNTEKNWDGFTLPRSSSTSVISSLAKVADFTPVGIVKSIGPTVLSMANAGFSAPDCYVLVNVGGRWFGGRETMNRDDYQPIWDVSLNVNHVGKYDNRIVNIVVKDADETEDDNVGSVQFKLSELIKTDGPQQKILFNENGKLHASGLLVIKLSVTKL